MKIIAVIGTTVVSLVLAAPLAMADRHGHGDKREDRSPHQQHGNAAHDNRGRSYDQKQVEKHHSGPQHAAQIHEQRPPRDVWQAHRARSWKHEHRSWHDRGGYVGYRVRDDHFRAHFGRAHWFRVHRYPIIVVDGRPRFQYYGYWITLADPWPEYWAANWYETDDVYVDYVNDGYYMYNRRHPGVAVAVNISF